VERERSWYTCRLFHLLVSLTVQKVYCGKTADWIRMPFRAESGFGRGMRVLDGVVIVKGKGQFGVNIGSPIGYNGDLDADLCESDALFPNDFVEDLFYSASFSF